MIMNRHALRLVHTSWRPAFASLYTISHKLAIETKLMCAADHVVASFCHIQLWKSVFSRLSTVLWNLVMLLKCVDQEVIAFRIHV